MAGVSSLARSVSGENRNHFLVQKNNDAHPLDLSVGEVSTETLQDLASPFDQITVGTEEDRMPILQGRQMQCCGRNASGSNRQELEDNTQSHCGCALRLNMMKKPSPDPEQQQHHASLCSAAACNHPPFPHLLLLLPPSSAHHTHAHLHPFTHTTNAHHRHHHKHTPPPPNPGLKMTVSSHNICDPKAYSTSRSSQLCKPSVDSLNFVIELPNRLHFSLTPHLGRVRRGVVVVEGVWPLRCGACL